MQTILHIENEQAMFDVAHQLAKKLSPGFIVYLQGDLGAGKTTLVRGILRAMGFSGYVKSPTFTLVEPYDIGTQTVYHFDLYRIDSPESLEFIGIRDYIGEKSICLIEWPEKGQGYLPSPDLTCYIEIHGNIRIIRIDEKH